MQALPADNPHLPDSYLDTLKDSFSHRPDLLEAYLHGSWEAFEGDDQVILEKWIVDAESKQLNKWTNPIISCDPARFGDDETVIYVMDGGKITDTRTMGKSKTTEISNAISRLSRSHGNCQAVVDEIGVGAGVVDELGGMGVSVIPFNSSSKSVEPDKYYNLRAEAWMVCAKLFSEGRISSNGTIDLKLKNQLLMPKYMFKTSGKIIIEPKDSIKKRLGSSPDRADAYIMGLWAGNKLGSAKHSITSTMIAKWRNKYRRVG